MEEIPLGQQRDLAEKLITEIMFLAKTNNLSFDTRIENPYFAHSPPSICSNRYQYMQNESNPSPPTQYMQNESNPSPPTLTQHYSPSPSHASSHSYIMSQPVKSPSPNCPIPIQSPTSPSSHTQHYSPAPIPSHSHQNFPIFSQITHPNSTLSSQNAVNVSENAVLYAEGPSAEILKELLVFKKHK